MDLSTITDLVTLKSMAYDQIALKEQAERNLSVINDRIAQVSAGPQQDKETAAADANSAAELTEGEKTEAAQHIDVDDSTTE